MQESNGLGEEETLPEQKEHGGQTDGSDGRRYFYEVIDRAEFLCAENCINCSKIPGKNKCVY